MVKMKLRKFQDFFGHWVVEAEEKHPMFPDEGMWIPVGEYTNETQADEVIKQVQQYTEFKPIYEFFNAGANTPEETGEGTPFGMLLEDNNDDENTEVH
jgi:hypothetical protein